jgi:hypothetical protein
MRLTTRIGAFAVLIGCAGCGAGSTGVQAVGSDLYTISGHYPAANGGVLIAQNTALDDARAFCQQQGRRFDAVSDAAGHAAGGMEATYSVQFRCLAESAPEFQRSIGVQAPADEVQ